MTLLSSASNQDSYWQKFKVAFGTPSAVTLLVFGFGCGLPFLPLGWVLSTWFRDEGLDLKAIGLFSFISWFYVVKFAWAPLLDRFHAPLLGRLGKRRGWLLLAQATVILGFFALGAIGVGSSLTIFLLVLAVTTLMGATQDTLVDAYRIEVAPLESQGALVATYSLGYRLGLIAGGAGVLYVADLKSWSAAYWMVAALMLIPLLTTLIVREPQPATILTVRPGIAEAFIDPFREFLSRNGLLLAVALLGFVGLYKMPDQMLGVLSGPFYLDTGFSKSQIATVSKLYGTWIGLAGMFAGGLTLALIGQRKALLAAALAVAVSNLLYILMSLHPGESWAFVAAISGDNFSQGFGGVVLVAFMSSLTSAQFTATQYALLSSFANLPGKLVAGVSGYIVEASSYTGFFILSALSIIPTLLLLAWLWNKIQPGSHSAVNLPR